MSGSAFSVPSRRRLDHSLLAAEAQTGLAFSVCVGPVRGDSRKYAETLLAALAEEAAGRVLIFVDPAGRTLEIVTSPPARHRLSDRACALTSLSMTTSFGVGDLVGGLVTGLRMLADATTTT